MGGERPIAKLSIPGSPTLELYDEFLVEKGGLFREAVVRELQGAEARVDNVGKSLTLKNQAVLVISSPGWAVIREAKGSRTVKAMMSFAAMVNAVAPA